MTDPEVGARIARWRRRRGLSQVALAGLVGRSESWLSQVERGLRHVDSLAVLRDLSRVLRVDLEMLAPSPMATPRGSNGPAHPVLEQALLAPPIADSTAATPAAAPVTTTEVSAMHLAYQDARYGDVLTALPTISVQLAGTGDPRMLAAGWAVVAKMLTKTGSWDLALLAADRAREAAYRSGDRADLGMAVFQVVCALLPTSRAAIGEDLATRTAHHLTPDNARDSGGVDAADDAAVRSVAGALWLIAAIAAARRSDTDAAADRLDRAHHLAQSLGRDANLRWTAFGPTNVALHRVTVAAELGDAPAAITAAHRLDPSRFPAPLRGRRVQVGLDLAWAYTCRRRDADAVLALLEVERAAPDATRHNVYARSTISTLLGRARGSTGGHIRGLATRNHVTL
jgi:transcriptional regulator with XRE-family HTH domain